MSTAFSDHLLEGDHASRPAATAVPAGTLYACSDHGLIYQSDGATWATWASLGGGAPAAHAASHENGGSDEIDVTGLTGAGGSGTFPLGLAAPDKIPGTPGAEDEEFEGTADTLPTDYAWVAAPAAWSINSNYPSWMLWERAAGNTTEYKLRISNFAMAATSGLWVKMGMGVPNGAGSQFEWIIYDSASSNGYGAGVHNGNVWVARDSNAGVLANRGTTTLGAKGQHGYIGVMRVSDTWKTYFSTDGIGWEMIQSADTRAFTVDRLEFRWSSDAGGFSGTWLGRAFVDWIRYRADNLFPRP